MNNIETKICSQCNEQKNLPDFVKRGSRYSLLCKGCISINSQIEINKILAEGGIPTKVCITCKIEKSYIYFYKAIDKKFGVGCACKDCFKDKVREKRTENKNKNNTKIIEALCCSICLEFKSPENFRKDNSSSRGYTISCKSCETSKTRIIPKNKRCPQCNLIKDSVQFNLSKWTNDGLWHCCKDCKKNKEKEYNDKNSEKRKEYRTANKEKFNNKQKLRYKSSPSFRIKSNLSSGLSKLLRGRGLSKTHPLLDIIDLSIKDLRKYLKSLFEPGMTWKNYGEWEIDHIIPMNLYDVEDINEQRKCEHHINLRPCWATTKIAKKHNSKSIGNSEKSDKLILSLLSEYHFKHLMPKHLQLSQKPN